MYKIIIGVIIAAAVVIIGFMIIDPKVNKNTVNPTTTDVTNNSNSGNSFTIEGEVNKPGTYSLGENVTIGDLIKASGGVTGNADDLAYFEDSTITAGNTYYIASKYDQTDICSSSAISKVNINSDDSEKLQSINGITASIASSIVSYRTSNGVFRTIEQLMEVYGIGNATYRKVRNFVTLHA